MTESGNITKPTARSRARAAAFVGLAVALMAVGSWVVIPLGPVPFTMQMFVIPLVIYLLPAPQAIAAIFAYVALGAIGVPVFSGMRGGLGMLMGPTGGFLLGYLVGVPAAAGLLWATKRKAKSKLARFAAEVAAGLTFTLVAYATGWLQYAAVSGMGLEAAFLTSVAPFIVPDIAKIVLAALAAQPIRCAV